jgi:hypothetical protein
MFGGGNSHQQQKGQWVSRKRFKDKKRSYGLLCVQSSCRRIHCGQHTQGMLLQRVKAITAG